SLAYQIEKQLAELGDKVPEADKTKVEGLIRDLRDAIAKEDDEAIKNLTTELQQAFYAVSSNLYQQAGGPTDGPGGATGGPGAGPTGGDDDVIDADFTDGK
ncbi:MAG: Hsp70 family protein, partial [Oscillatoriales cyanobacterium RU_3_3]|nr:Hsp70 family protein [Oscillatoriales cyanobacterium RU_3_3]